MPIEYLNRNQFETVEQKRRRQRRNIFYNWQAGGNLFSYGAKTFAGADFAGSGAMTWTVDQADQSYFRFGTRANVKSVAIQISLANTTVGGTVAGASLTLKIPGGALATGIQTFAFTCTPAGGPPESCIATTAAGSNLISMRRANGLDWVAGTDNTNVQGNAIIKVQ